MELELIEETDTTLEVKVGGESFSMLQILQERLLQKEEVEYATFFIGHQKLDTPHFFVRVLKGSPRKLVMRVINEISKDYLGMRKRVQ